MEIANIRKQINRGLNINEYRKLLEENNVSNCFFCSVFKLKKQLKEVWIKNMKVFVCSYCYNKRKFSEPQEIIDETSDSMIETLDV
jgi:hypothetical protein